MTPKPDFERQTVKLVDEFLQRDLVDRGVAERVERLYAEDRPAEALETILRERRRNRMTGQENRQTEATRSRSR